VALDLAGDEARFSLDVHIPAFRFAIERGVRRTAHTGEAAGADSVWQTLRAFEPERVGHGVRSIEDPALIEHLRTHRIHLEICPSSNVQIGVVAEYQQHPVDRMLQAGLSLGINTDTRTISNIALSKEYERLKQSFGWSGREFADCNRNALDAAVLDESTKKRLTPRLSVD
jgi:adenosine deaminase